MIRFLIVTAALGLLICNTTYADDNDSPLNRVKRFDRGIPLTVEAHPTVVSVLYNDRHICSGTVYDQDLILTAAHCIAGKWYKNLKIRIENLSKSTTFDVRGVEYHEQFDSVNFTNDVGMLRTLQRLALSTSVKKVKLANNATILPRGSSVKYLSWSSIIAGSRSVSEQLVSDQLTVISNSECAELWGDFGENSLENQFCANVSSGSTAFLTDTGGPLLYDNEQIGIISSSECGRENVPEISTNVSAVSKWIHRAGITLMNTNVGYNPMYNLSSAEKEYYESWYGIFANKSEVPSLVALVDEHTGTLKCLGSLIAADLVLTTAKCVKIAEELGSVAAYTGEMDDEYGSQKNLITGYHPNPSFDENHSRYLHNIGLLRLEKPVVWSISTQPAKLINDDDKAKAGDSGSVYRFVKGDGIRYLETKLIQNDECTWIYGRYGGIDDGQICAKSRFGMCSAVLGAPLIVRGHVVGLLSKIYKDCYDYRYPGIYTKVTDYARWISGFKTYVSERTSGGLRK